MQLCLFFLQQERNIAVVDVRDHFRQFTHAICAQVEKAPLLTGISVGVPIVEDTGNWNQDSFAYMRYDPGVFFCGFVG